jgi:hypothetical protein
MSKKSLFALAVALAALAATSPTGTRQVSADASQPLSPAQVSAFTILDGNLVPLEPATTDPPGHFNSVTTFDFDPSGLDTVQSAWIAGIGCPNAVATKNASGYTDTQCAGTFDPNDLTNEGLLLEKGGPTAQNEAGVAALHNVQGITLTELGYDIRTTEYPPIVGRGSHCGAGAPRFDVYTTVGLFFVGCVSPVADAFSSDVPGSGGGWTRLRWGVPASSVPVCGFPAFTAPVPTPCPNHPGYALITGTVQHIYIVFDEGTDTNNDFFGTAMLDNVDVNGQLVGKGGS